MGGDIHKLVRDRIPDELHPDDKANRVRTAQPGELARLLTLKYAEESSELHRELLAEDKAKIIDEMADVQEVIDALRQHFNITEEEVANRRVAKRLERGGFTQHSVLTVPIPEDTERWHMSHVGPVVPFLNRHILQSKHIRIAVSFILNSGLTLLIDAFKQALANDCKIDLLTSRYLGVTEPQALRSLLALDHQNLSVRLYDREGKSFHAKAWLFTGRDDRSAALIGSSNISWMALNHGVEWNYHVHETDAGWPVHEALDHFENLFTHPSTVALNASLIEEYEQTRKPVIEFEKSKPTSEHSPNPAQREALQRLRRLRYEGHTRGMVIAATGVGKTWLAAFDSERFERVLFIAHRKELLLQAERTFRQLRPFDTIGRLYAGETRTDADLVFASMQTLGRDNLLESIQPDAFDYIVVDEFHHAGSKNYLKILQRFKPQFLLGLTATPYRSDNCDLLELCDGNVAYRVTLHEAIGLGWLSPFRYFGVNDDTDYGGLKLQNGEYRIEELERLIINNHRNEDILKQYQCHTSRCAIGFCASITHAEHLSAFFRSKGIKAAALHSKTEGDDADSLQQLRQGNLAILFAVDMLNEGVDVPEIDLVMFLRPTQSVTVFLQQLGRGLRLHNRKSHLTVLDFISNYKNADFKLPALVGDLPDDIEKANRDLIKRLKSNDGVWNDNPNIQLHLDSLAIEKLRALAKDPITESLIDAFNAVKTDLGRQATISDIFQYGRYKPRTYIQTFKDGTPKSSWFGALEKAGLISPDEVTLHQNSGDLLATVETTDMNRCYKMIILQALLDNSALHSGLSLDALADAFRIFYAKHPTARMEMSESDLEKLEPSRHLQLRKLILQMPINFWGQTHFHYDEGEDRWRCTSVPENPPASLYDALRHRVQYRIDKHLERFDLALSKFKIVCGQKENSSPHIDIERLRAQGTKPSGWHKVEIGEECLYAKLVTRAINVLKREPMEGREVPNVLAEKLCELFGVADPRDLQGKYVSIEPNSRGDGFVVTRYRSVKAEE